MVSSELQLHFNGHFLVLILDNEVTVENFVTAPPLPWARLVNRAGSYRVSEGYPCLLTTEVAKREMRNWDTVHLPAIIQTLKDLGDGIHCVVFGNNAGQGFSLAENLPTQWRKEKAAIIYARSLPEISDYEALGYSAFVPRGDLVSYVREQAEAAGRPLALAFINTIQHDASNYHDP